MYTFIAHGGSLIQRWPSMRDHDFVPARGLPRPQIPSRRVFTPTQTVFTVRLQGVYTPFTGCLQRVYSRDSLAYDFKVVISEV